MRITVEKQGTHVAISSEHENLSKADILEACGKACDIIEGISDKVYTKCDCENSKAPIPEEPAQMSLVQPATQESPLIRPRIPNNVVDVNELNVKQAVTENALVRCPKCGQSHVLAVNSGNHVYVMRKVYESNEFKIVAEFDSITAQGLIDMCCNEDTDRQAYFNDIQTMKTMDDNDFAVTNETSIFCPVCCQSDTFYHWKNAYENPLEYFETEHICDACGGEKLEKLIKRKKVYQCDKCGLTQDFKEE